jgi:trimeric autotransporter adhesin
MTRYSYNGKYLTFNNSYLVTQKNIPRDGLIAEWLFSGNADDTIGNGNNGALVNSPTLVSDRFGNTNSSYEFNGVDQWIESINSNFLNYLTKGTFSFWFSGNATQSAFLSYYNDILNITLIQIFLQSSSEIRFQFYDFATTNINYHISTVFNFASDTYYHIVYTYDGDGHKCYINSQEYNVVASATPNYYISDLINSVGDLYLTVGCRRLPSEGRFFNGVIDDLRIYDRVLSSEEINQLYKEGGYSP